MKKTIHIVVIGKGIIGLCTAIELAKTKFANLTLRITILHDAKHVGASGMAGAFWMPFHMPDSALVYAASM